MQQIFTSSFSFLIADKKQRCDNFVAPPIMQIPCLRKFNTPPRQKVFGPFLLPDRQLHITDYPVGVVFGLFLVYWVVKPITYLLMLSIVAQHHTLAIVYL